MAKLFIQSNKFQLKEFYPHFPMSRKCAIFDIPNDADYKKTNHHKNQRYDKKCFTDCTGEL